MKTFLVLSTILLLALVNNAKTTCPEGWTLVGNKCLQLINEIRTYDEAVSHCISINGNLTEPRTDIEADQVWDFTRNKRVWIGINDKDQENKFIYESNGQEASFLRWSPNEPNNLFDEDCVMTWTVDGWNDKGCDTLLSFVCEISGGAENGSEGQTDTFKGFGGTVFKAHSNYSTPRGVRIQWMNFLEGDDVRDGTAFNMTMESNKIDETNFMISVSANCIKKFENFKL